MRMLWRGCVIPQLALAALLLLDGIGECGLARGYHAEPSSMSPNDRWAMSERGSRSSGEAERRGGADGRKGRRMVKGIGGIEGEEFSEGMMVGSTASSISALSAVVPPADAKWHESQEDSETGTMMGRNWQRSMLPGAGWKKYGNGWGRAEPVTPGHVEGKPTPQEIQERNILEMEEEGRRITLKIERLRLQGNDLVEHGDFERALRAYDNCLGINPNDPAVLCNRAHVYNAMGRHHEADDDCTKALNLAENEKQRSRLLYRRGIARLARGRPNQAQHDAAEALLLQPGNAQIMTLLDRIKRAVIGGSRHNDSHNTEARGEYHEKNGSGVKQHAANTCSADPIPAQHPDGVALREQQRESLVGLKEGGGFQFKGLAGDKTARHAERLRMWAGAELGGGGGREDGGWLDAAAGKEGGSWCVRQTKKEPNKAASWARNAAGTGQGRTRKEEVRNDREEEGKEREPAEREYHSIDMGESHDLADHQDTLRTSTHTNKSGKSRGLFDDISSGEETSSLNSYGANRQGFFNARSQGNKKLQGWRRSNRMVDTDDTTSSSSSIEIEAYTPNTNTMHHSPAQVRGATGANTAENYAHAGNDGQDEIDEDEHATSGRRMRRNHAVTKAEWAVEAAVAKARGIPMTGVDDLREVILSGHMKREEVGPLTEADVLEGGRALRGAGMVFNRNWEATDKYAERIYNITKATTSHTMGFEDVADDGGPLKLGVYLAPHTTTGDVVNRRTGMPVFVNMSTEKSDPFMMQYPSRLSLLLKKDEMGLHNTRADFTRGFPYHRFPSINMLPPLVKAREEGIPDHLRYEDMTALELREELAKKGMKSTGNKTVLTKRLLDPGEDDYLKKRKTSKDHDFMDVGVEKWREDHDDGDYSGRSMAGSSASQQPHSEHGGLSEFDLDGDVEPWGQAGVNDMDDEDPDADFQPELREVSSNTALNLADPYHHARQIDEAEARLKDRLRRDVPPRGAHKGFRHVIPESEFKRVLGPEKHKMLLRREHRARGDVDGNHDVRGERGAEGGGGIVSGDESWGRQSLDIIYGDEQAQQLEEQKSPGADGAQIHTQVAGSMQDAEPGDGAPEKERFGREERGEWLETNEKFAKYTGQDGNVDFGKYALDTMNNVRYYMNLGKKHVARIEKERGVEVNQKVRKKGRPGVKKGLGARRSGTK